MMLKEKIRMYKVDELGKKHKATFTVYGRTETELRGRVEKTIHRQILNDYKILV